MFRFSSHSSPHISSVNVNTSGHYACSVHKCRQYCWVDCCTIRNPTPICDGVLLWCHTVMLRIPIYWQYFKVHSVNQSGLEAMMLDTSYGISIYILTSVWRHGWRPCQVVNYVHWKCLRWFCLILPIGWSNSCLSILLVQYHWKFVKVNNITMTFLKMRIKKQVSIYLYIYTYISQWYVRMYDKASGNSRKTKLSHRSIIEIKHEHQMTGAMIPVRLMAQWMIFCFHRYTVKSNIRRAKY